MSQFRKVRKLVIIEGTAGEVNTKRLQLSQKVVKITGIKVTNLSKNNTQSAYKSTAYGNGYL